ncbi:thymidine kinase, cytosolic-like [Sycon ciliatum]|uniref:thymidine kinase, cytosolic-like n=1 Tax=Sycon ciliatum TaxID=27933 RepID=UPI0020A9BC52|eukprot:scpid80020/ scgid7361/ Thymidine kinase, cytosolic
MSMAMSPDRMSSSVRGQIQVIIGPMFSGKTTELIRRIRRFEVAQHKALLIKYDQDNRYDNECVATHDRHLASNTKTTKSSTLLPLMKQAIKFNVVGIDEGQFFPDIVEFCETLARHGKTVIVAALDGTFQRQAFGDVLNLIPLAESVVKLKAVCMHCCQDASFTRRLGQETEVEVIGGADKYVAVCRKCFHLPTLHPDMLTPTRDFPQESRVSRQLVFTT